MTTPNPTDSRSGYDTGIRRLFWIGAAISFVLSFVLYARTMQGGASFWDSGEFIAAAYRLGIPHSPGTPLYVLVGRVFSMLPIPGLGVAQQVNLLSAFCGGAGILFAFMLTIRFLDFTLGKSESLADGLVKVAGALTGALFLAFSSTYWTNATEAEVYAMSNALMGFMMWLTLKWGESPRGERATFLIYLTFYLLALSVGFHLGTILVFSGIFFYILMTPDRSFSTFEFLLACVGVAIFIADATLYRNGKLTLTFLAMYAVVLLWMQSRRSSFATITTLLFFLGLSVHLYLLIRSRLNPILDEGNPETWRALYAVLRREQYPPTHMFPRHASWGFQFAQFNGYFQAQFEMARAYVGRLNMGSLLPIGLGVWGMVDHFVRHRKTFIMLFVTLLVTSLGLIVFLNFTDHEVRERAYFYSSGFYFFAIFIGMGSASLLSELRATLARGTNRISPVVAVMCAVFVAFPFFTGAHHFFSHDRSRNTVCSRYAHNMLVGLEKNAVVFTNGDNDTFPLWYIQEVESYRKDVRVINLSLLNTPWYIRQCRDNPPRVPISWSDRQVDQLRPVPVKNGWLLIRDLAVREILKVNFSLPADKRRPIYFAVTIPPATYAPYRKYMEMQGLEYKVVQRKGDNMINVSRMEMNVVHNFDYTGILTADWKRDHSIYLPGFTEHLIQNYAAAFIQLAYIAHQDSSYDKAVRYLEAANQISPQMQPPRQMLGLFYLDAGDTTKAINYYKRRMVQNPNDVAFVYRLAGVYERLQNYDEAADLIDSVLARYRGQPEVPGLRDLVMSGYLMAVRANQFGRARRYLSAWLAKHPSDDEARRLIGELDRNLSAGKGSSSQ